jgi:hypothetical protein
MPTKQTSPKKRISRKRSSSSNIKKTWEKFLKNNKKILVDSWKSPNPQKEYSKTVRELHKKYLNTRKN